MLPSPKLLQASLRDALVSQLLVQPLATYLLLLLLSLSPDRYAALPSFPMTVLHMSAALLFNELSFYLLHRLFHEVPFLYQRVHKQHHQYVGTVAVAAEHAHPVEQLLCNDLPVVGYCLAMRLHPLLWAVYLAWRLQETYETHSGYCFHRQLLARVGLWSGPQAEFHDFHHTVNSGNYGHHLMDELFGTMDLWLSLTQNGVIPHSTQKKQLKAGPASQQERAPIYLRDPSRKQMEFHLGYTCIDS